MWRTVREQIYDARDVLAQFADVFAKEGPVNGRQVPILHTVSALESMRNRGITLRNAIRECVDNSWDWMGPAKLLGTAQIRVHLQKQGDLLTVSVLDNGMGIADHVVEAPDGQGEVVSERTDDSMDGLQMALRVGGRIKKHHVSPIGRFGFGLPQSGIALCYDTHMRVCLQNQDRVVALAGPRRSGHARRCFGRTTPTHARCAKPRRSSR